MLKLLIAEQSETIAEGLAAAFAGDFEVRTCQDGETALEELLSFRPDALIVNLYLPFRDGLTLLQESAHRPRVILMVAPFVSEYVKQCALELGIQYIVSSPTISTVRVCLTNMLAVAAPKEELSAQVVVQLHTLNFHTHLDGYRQLCVGIPMYAKNPGMALSKELYPAISKELGLSDQRNVEHSVRKSITDAWLLRDPLVWERYFPGRKTPPSNKVFISRLAEMLKL